MEYIEIAKAVKPHGIKGEIKLQHYCDRPDSFYDFDTLYIKEGTSFTAIEILNIRTDHTSVYVKLDILKTRDDADNIRGTMFYVDKADIKSVSDDAFMVRDLIGIKVFDEDKNLLGKLKEILQHGSADIYVVKSEEKGFMFPALATVIKHIDIENKSMILIKSALLEVAVYED